MAYCDLAAFFFWLAEYFKWFAMIILVFYIGMIFYLFNCGMDSTAKLTWLFLIMVFQIPAAIFLWFTQRNIGHRTLKKRTDQMIRDTKEALKQNQETLARPELISSGTDDLCRYLNRSGCFPIYENTEVTYFPLGEEKFAAVLEELKKANHFIYMEYFILDEGLMWGSILKILAEKAAQGVDVRVMYDGMCEISTLSSDYPKRMRELGIKCKAFAPLKPFVSSHYNYRDHRKILDNELETALKFAAERGVDVKLILPGIPDKKTAYSLAKSHYKSLTDAGIRIYEYTPGFVHAKVFVSDNEKAVVGTINLDYRSLYHHFECATYLYRTECIGKIETDFQSTLAKCQAVTDESIRKEKISLKILGGIMKLIAPLM